MEGSRHVSAACAVRREAVREWRKRRALISPQATTQAVGGWRVSEEYAEEGERERERDAPTKQRTTMIQVLWVGEKSA